MRNGGSKTTKPRGGVLDLIETIAMSSRRVQFSTMPLGKSIGRKEARVGRYLVSLAPPRVRALFAAARQWERALEFPVDGGPCCGALAEIIVHYCRAGMRNHPKPKPGQSGYDCRDAQGRRVQIKAIGHGKPWFQFTIDPSQAERLIVLR